MVESKVTPILIPQSFYYLTYANLPILNVRVGAMGYATDRLVLYRWSGAAWQEVSIHSSSGVVGNIPAVASMPEGSLYFATDTLDLYQVQVGVWVIISSVGGDYPQYILPNIVRWKMPGWDISSLGVVAITANVIYYQGIFVDVPTTYIRIGVEVTAVVVSTLDLRIFNCLNGLPTELILDCGNINFNIMGLNEIVIAQHLPRGYYFLALRTAGGGGQLKGVGPTDYSSPMKGSNLTNAQVQDPIMLAAAPWADPAPAPTATVNAARACIWLREN